MRRKKKVVTVKEKISRLVHSLRKDGTPLIEAKRIVDVMVKQVAGDIGCEPNVRCHYCQDPVVFAKASIDHCQPVSRNGVTQEGNLVWSCRRCNTAKGNLCYDEFINLLHALDDIRGDESFHVKDYVLKRLYAGANLYRRFGK